MPKLCVCLCPKPIVFCIHLTQLHPAVPGLSFSLDKVKSLLSNLDSDSATSRDSISPRVLKTCSAFLALSLCSIHPLICSRSSAIFLKISKHHCHAQKGAKTGPCNYRPISLLPIISKVMESIITSDIKSFLGAG